MISLPTQSSLVLTNCLLLTLKWAVRSTSKYSSPLPTESSSLPYVPSHIFRKSQWLLLLLWGYHLPWSLFFNIFWNNLLVSSYTPNFPLKEENSVVPKDLGRTGRKIIPTGSGIILAVFSPSCLFFSVWPLASSLASLWLNFSSPCRVVESYYEQSA